MVNCSKSSKKTSKKTSKKVSKKACKSSKNSCSNNLSFGAYSDLVFDSNSSGASFGRSAFGLAFKRTAARFGALEVPSQMRPVSSFRGASMPLTIMPFGPGGSWLEEGHEGAGSSMAGSSMNSFGRGNSYGNSYGAGSLEGRDVNPAGYLSTWNGQPRVVPPSWNPLLLQGQNTFVEGINSPHLQNVVSFGNQFGNQFGKKRSSSKKAVHTDARTSKGWGKISKKLDRGEMPKSCFLGKGMKYPVCNSDGQIDCRGVLAAMQRSRKGSSVHKKAMALGKKHGCAWA